MDVPGTLRGSMGALLTQPGQAQPQVFDAAGFVATDISCRRCGYNLRGLTAQGCCPECNTPVGLSAYGDLLYFADPRWVEKVSRGALFTLLGMLAAFIGAFAGVAIALVLKSEAAGQVVMVAASLVSVYGAWLLTTPDPGHIGEDRYARARVLTRVSVLFGLAGSVVTVLIHAAPADLSMVIGVLGLVAGLVELVGRWFYMVYVEYLFSRVPDPKKARDARQLRWGFLVAYLLVAGGLGAQLLLPMTPLGAIPMLIGGLVMLVCAILFLVLMINFRSAMANAARAARQTWAAASPPA